MSNDITALMATMKAAAERANHAGAAQIMPFDTRIAALNEFLLIVCPANVLALVEALELSHRYIERLREWNANLAHESCEYQNRIAELENAASEPVAWTDEAELRDVEKDGCGYLFTVNPITPNADPRRIIKLYTAPPALESRTVTVKLPKRSVAEVMLLSGFDRQYAEGWCSGNDNAIHEMRAAGIQVIEGEHKNV